ncbi:hypothetical protein [Pedobacter alpinus]|uniref:Uncharacterized protein n=1 Tax=Pedobacter alpinus TaxID=1590643 RepID=A0ABW5TU41_9SPHI
MKSEKTIYIKCDKSLFSNNSLYSVLLACTVVSGLSFSLNFYQIISELTSYLILSICSLLTTFSLYRLSVEKGHHYIYINDDEICFTKKDQNDTVSLKFEGLDYFETRFSKIIFSTKSEEKIEMELNRIADEKKRWQLKEFLKDHLKQNKDSKI